MTEKLYTRNEAAVLICQGNLMQDVKDKCYHRFNDGRFEAARDVGGQPIWYHEPFLYDRDYILIQPKAGRDE